MSNEDLLYTVYMHTTPSKKNYIGITSKKVEDRWSSGYKNNKHFSNAINKYGWDNIEHKIIAKNLSKEDAELLEIKLIKEFDSTNPSKGYNRDLGGNSVGKHSNEVKAYISQKTKEGLSNMSEDKKVEIRKNFLEKVQSEEHRKKLSEVQKGLQSGEKHPLYGKHHKEETKKKISNTLTGKYGGEKHPLYNKRGFDCKTSKLVVCLNTGVIYGGAKDVERKLGIDHHSVSNACRGIYKGAGKSDDNIKLAWALYDDYKKMSDEEIQARIKNANTRVLTKTTGRMVICLTTGKIYNSIKEASIDTGVRSSGITMCCRGQYEWSGIDKNTGEPLKWSYYNI